MPRLGPRGGVAGPHGGVIGQVEDDAPAMVAVQRLDRHRVADGGGRSGRLLLVADHLGARHRHAGRRQQLVGQLLVGRDVDAQRAGLAGHGGADALLVDAVAQLHQRLLVQADGRDVAQGGLVQDGLGRRAERRALGQQDQLLELDAEVEVRLRRDQVVDQPHRQAPGRQAHALLAERVDDVVLPRLAGAAGLAAADLGAGLALQLQRDVLGHVAQPGALAQAPGEAAGAARAAGVAADLRQHVQQPLDEAGNGARRELLQHAQVDHQLDGGLVAPVVRPTVDPRLDDLQLSGRLELSCGWPRCAPPSPSSARRAGAWRRRCSFAGLLVHASRAAPPDGDAHAPVRCHRRPPPRCGGSGGG